MCGMRMLKRIFHRGVSLWLAGLMVAAPVLAAAPRDCLPPDPKTETPAQPCYENDELSVRVVMRTSEQLTAFYLGREFSRAAIDKILETCFVTPIVHNKTVDVLWLELDESYRTEKIDPGDRFMTAVRDAVADLGLEGPP